MLAHDAPSLMSLGPNVLAASLVLLLLLVSVSFVGVQRPFWSGPSHVSSPVVWWLGDEGCNRRGSRRC
ncbi:hypothetical protein Pyn_35277 [Prunus yedoensis var. nudiflora]|uniref:Uncharacterized protein n=1 Tax=Prunus yedoensis var. nudiflora TaxID=2094558 RepID=A0A315AQF1_PRUYE|nr:hypothetical protein Pyn_35277 [Prunus yedoensis var. nudiflora]